MSPWKSFGWVAGAAFGFRMVILLGVGPSPAYAFTADSPSYYEPAQNLLHQRTFATVHDHELVPEIYRTPGYPVFLLPFLSDDGRVHHRSVQWAQAVLNSFSAGLVFLAALLFWKNQKAAWAAGLAFAFDFVNAIHCAFVLTDILFVFLLSLVLFLLVKRQMLWAGFTASLAAFVRPAGLYYPVVLALILLVAVIKKMEGVFFKRLAIFLLVSFLPLTAWIYRNHHVAGRWTFTTLEDANIFLVRAALVEMERKHIPYEAAVEEVQKAYRESRGIEPAGQWGTHYLLTHWRDYSKIMMKDVLKLLSGNSIKVAAWAILKDDRYNPSVIPVHSSESPFSQARELVERHRFLGIGMVLYLFFLALVYLLAAFGVWTAVHQKGWGETLLVFSSVIYFAVITLGVDAQARYRLPIMPALFLFAGGGFFSLFSNGHADRR